MRQEEISFNVDLDQVDTLGESAMLFFLNIKHCLAMMLAGFIVFSVYSLASNIIAASNTGSNIENSTTDCLQSDHCGLGQISLGIKLADKTALNREMYLGQAWLGLGLVVVWIGMLVFKASR
jgi:hypothetical protein